MLDYEKKRIDFMRAVAGDTWKKMEEAGVTLTYGQIRNRLSEILSNQDVIEEVANVFYKRIIS